MLDKTHRAPRKSLIPMRRATMTEGNKSIAENDSEEPIFSIAHEDILPPTGRF